MPIDMNEADALLARVTRELRMSPRRLLSKAEARAALERALDAVYGDKVERAVARHDDLEFA